MHKIAVAESIQISNITSDFDCLYKTNSLVVKECFHNVWCDVRFRKL